MSRMSQLALDRLKRAYAAYYDIEDIEDGTPLKALCAYHMRDSQYVLVKKAELWAAENHEYLYLCAVDHLDEGAVDQIFQRVLEDGEPQALAKLRKLKKRREYKLSLHGWMEFRIAAVDLSTGEITVNRAGRAIQKDLKRLTGSIISAYHLGEEKTQ